MSVQPQRKVIPIRAERSTSLSARDQEAVLQACERLKALPGGLLPILHAVQQALGYVPKEAVPLIASALNLSLAEVHGVVTFYHYFRQHPPGRHVLHLCRAEACQAVGAAALEAHAKSSLGIELHGTTADGAVTLEPVYCLGNCALGPSLMLDERLHGRVTSERFDILIAQARGAAVARP
jgi:formate dehydrogenase subunit gamma